MYDYYLAVQELIIFLIVVLSAATVATTVQFAYFCKLCTLCGTHYTYNNAILYYVPIMYGS